MGLNIERFEQLLGGCDELAKVLIREHVTELQAVIERKNRVITALQQTILIDAPIVERLQRENAELQQSSDFWKAETIGQNTTISTMRDKLAAAETQILLDESKQREATLTLERDAARNALEIARNGMKTIEHCAVGSTVHFIATITLAKISDPTAALAERDRVIREECAVLCENTSLPSGDNFGKYYADAIRNLTKL